MGVNISGRGVLSGLATLVIGAVNNFNLLVTKLIGYTSVSGGGSSYYTTTEGALSPGYVGVTIQGNAFYSLDGVTGNKTSPENFGFLTDITPIFEGAAPWNSWSQPLYKEESSSWIITSGKGYNVTSTDGINWTRASRGGLTASITPAVIDGKFWTIGTQANDADLETTTLYPLWSNDGNYWEIPDSWPSYNFPTGGTTSIHYMPYNQRYVIFSYVIGVFQGVVTNDPTTHPQGSGNPWSSWTTINVPPNVNETYFSKPTMFAPGTSYERLVTIGDSGKVYVTENGKDWFQTDDLSTLPNPAGLTYSLIATKTDSKLIAIDSAYVEGSPSLKVYVSGSGGDSWYLAYENAAFGEVTFAATDSEVFIYSGEVVLNYDGTSWTTKPTNKLFSFSPILVENNIIFARSGDDLVSSLDGENWSNLIGTGTYSFPSLSGVGFGKISTLREVQVAIGNQGEEGAEILAPVDVYTVPMGKRLALQNIEIVNGTSLPLTYDIGVLNPWETLSDSNSITFDNPVAANTTESVSVTGAYAIGGQSITVLPSTVDALTTKVYGTLSDVFFDINIADFNANLASDLFNVYITTTNNKIRIGINDHGNNLTSLIYGIPSNTYISSQDDDQYLGKSAVIEGLEWLHHSLASATGVLAYYNISLVNYNGQDVIQTSLAIDTNIDSDGTALFRYKGQINDIGGKGLISIQN